MRRVIVVGASLAGLRAAERLRVEGFDGRLIMLGGEPHPPYDRPPLSKALLAGNVEPPGLSLRMSAELDAEWMLGDPAVGLDVVARVIRTAAGRRLRYDGLVIATGSAPRRLAALDPDRPGVHELRTLGDALVLRDALRRASKLLIVGGGFVGVEVASTARALGLEVTIATLDAPLAAAGSLVSDVVSEQLADHGVEVRTGRRVDRALGGARVEGIELDDGTRLEADVVLSAVGAAPCTDWLRGSGLRLSDGVVCDACCAAGGAPRIVAAGDVARWRHPRHGTTLRVEHWTNAVEQAIAAARTLLHGRAAEREYAPVPSFWSDHFGTRVQSLGLPGAADRFEVVEGSVAERRFAAAAHRDGELIGAVAYGLPTALAPLRARLAGAGSAVGAGAVAR